MSFSSPAWLFLLLLVPLVILLHALALRWRSAPVSSLLFWSEVLKERKAGMRIRRFLASLVLLLEVLAVVALAAALAGPRILFSGAAGAGDVILVLDARASMQAREGARTRFDVARERGLAIVAGLRRGSRMAVVLAARGPRLVSAFTQDRAFLRRAIRDSVPTDEPGDVASSVVFAISLRDSRRGGQVILETDGTFDELAGVDMSLPWIRVDIVGTPQDNVGITRMSFRRTAVVGAPYELFLAVRNAGRAPVSVPLTVRAGGREVISRTLGLAAGQRATVSLPWNGPVAGRVEAELKTGDAFPLDDRAYAVFAPARRVQVLLVGPDPWFVEKALNALPGVAVRAQTGPVPRDADRAEGPPDDVTVFVGVQPPEIGTGNFIFFAAVPPNLPLRVRGSLRVPPVTGWSRTDPLLDAVSLAGVTIGQALDLDPGPGFSVLAASRLSPLVLSWDHAGVKALIVAFDPGGSDFPLRPGFPVLLANALSWFFPTWLEAQADQVPAGGERLISIGSAESIVVKPDGRQVHLDSTGPSTIFSDTDETGFYRVESGASSGEFAVNLESDSTTDISPRFRAPSAAAPANNGPAGNSVPVWAGLAAAALALMLMEWMAWLWRPGRLRA